MSDQPVRTRVLGPDGWLGFQEYFVREKTQVEVTRSGLRGRARSAARARACVEAIALGRRGHRLPVNPITSIGPILAVPGIVRARWRRRARPSLAVSPIVGGQAVSGPGRDVSWPRAGCAVSAARRRLRLRAVARHPARGRPGRGAHAAHRSRRDTHHRDGDRHARPRGEIALARQALEALA